MVGAMLIGGAGCDLPAGVAPHESQDRFPNDLPQQAQPVTVPAVVTGTLDIGVDERDWYELQGDFGILGFGCPSEAIPVKIVVDVYSREYVRRAD